MIHVRTEITCVHIATGRIARRNLRFGRGVCCCTDDIFLSISEKNPENNGPEEIDTFFSKNASHFQHNLYLYN